MKKHFSEILIVVFLVLFSLFLFRQYIVYQEVPLNGKLLLSFFEPWTSYKWNEGPVGIANKPIGFDALRIFYPTRKVVIQEEKSGELPSWNPYQFSGNVLIATFQSAVFFPLGILFLILPQIDAWTIIVMLEPFLGALFMYLFLSQIIKDKKAAFFGALIFGFSGMLICWWEEMFMAGYAVILLPLLLYSIEKVYKKVQPSSVFLLSAVAFFSLSTGWFQMILYSWIFAACWALYRFFVTKSKISLLFVILSFIIAALISGIHLIPSFEAYTHSIRNIADVKIDFQTYLMPLTHLVNYVIPDILGNPAYYNYFGSGFYQESVLYVGIVGLLFAVYELIALGHRKKEEIFFIIAWIVTVSLGLSLPTSWFLLYTLKIPLISTLLPSRIFFVSAFCVSVLAAYGMQYYLTKIKNKQLVVSIAIIVLLFAGAIYYARYFGLTYSGVMLRNTMLPLTLFILTVFFVAIGLVKKNLKIPAYIALIVITIIGISFFAEKYLYFSPKKFIFPQTPVVSQLQKISGINRFLGIGNAYIDRNFAMYYGLYSPEGYDSFNNRRYSELVYSSQTKGQLSTKMPRADVQISCSNASEDCFNNPYRRTMINLLGVKYFVEKAGEKFDPVQENKFNIKPIWTDGVFRIYENMQAIPRVLVAYKYSVLQDNQEIFNKLYDDNNSNSKTIILETKPNLPIDKIGEGQVKIDSYKPTQVVLTVATTENGILMLTDNIYPGWKAYIDGKEAPIYRADYTFKAVIVPKGRHSIIFTYQSFAVNVGLIVSGFGLLLFVGILYSLKRFKYNI